MDTRIKDLPPATAPLSSVRLPIDSLAAGTRSIPLSVAQGNEFSVKKAFTLLNDGVVFLVALEPGDLIVQTKLVLLTPFDDPAATLSIGTVGSPGLFLGVADIDTQSAKTTDNGDAFLIGAVESAQLTIFAGASTVGAGIAYIRIARLGKRNTPMANVFQKLNGIVNALFQIGTGGPNLKSNSGALEARNAADSAYAIARGATPVGANDLTTKAYVDAAAGSANAVKAIEITVSGTPGNFDSTASLPAGARVIGARVNVTTAYNGTTPTITVGTTASPTGVMTAAESDATTVGLYLADTAFTATAVPARAVLAGTGTTTGAATVTLFYVETPST